jgi:CHAD domain-containing protein
MPRPIDRHDLLRKRLERFTRTLQGVEAGDVRAVHRARVASRRLREVLPVLRLGADATQKLGRRLRKVTVRLGVVREFDVLLAVLDELAASGRYQPEAIELVRTNIAKDRGQVRARLLAKVPMHELGRLATRLDKTVKELKLSDAGKGGAGGTPWRPPSWRWAVDARTAHRAAALAVAVTDAGAIYLPERLHAVRIAVKKLRYALELSADVARLRSTPDLTQLRRLQAVLGRLHDLQMLIDGARQAQASLTPPDITVWRQLDVLIVLLEDDCRRLHGRYMHDRDALLALSSRLSAGAGEGRSHKLKVRR